MDPEAIDLYSHEKLPIVQEGQILWARRCRVLGVETKSKQMRVELYTKESSLDCSLRINNHNRTYLRTSLLQT